MNGTMATIVNTEADENALRRRVRKMNKEISSKRKKDLKEATVSLRTYEREIEQLRRQIESGAPSFQNDANTEDDETKYARLVREVEALKEKTRTTKIEDFQKQFDLVKLQTKRYQLDRTRQFHIKSRERLVKSALERVRPARHKAQYNPLRTNAHDIIMRPFEGLGPSEQGKPLTLGEDDLWPVQKGRGTDKIQGAKPWYRTTNGKIFGEQKLEEMPAHYRATVIKNNTIRKQNEEIWARRNKTREARQNAMNSFKKPQRPWTAPSGVSKIFNKTTSLRPPTDLENQKISKMRYPDRANPGHRREGMPMWKCG